MKVCLLLLLSVLASAYAHTYFSSLTVDGRAYNEGECVKRHPMGTANFPIPFVTDSDMTCGWRPLADQATSSKCPVNPGSRVTVQWHHERPSQNDMILDPSHKGPVMVYMAKSESGAGAVWFKIYEEGLISPSYWATDKLINNRGKLDFTIPTDIAPGNYLLRAEIIALHSAYGINGAQPYVGCAEITVGGSGSANPARVSIPGVYKNTDPGIYINIYNGVSNYVIPGPAVYKSGSAPSTSGNTPPVPPTTPPAPSAGVSVFYDSVQSPTFSDWSWASVRNSRETKYVYSGSYSYSFVPQQWQGVYLACQGCIDTAKFDRIEFYVNGGDTGGQKVNFDIIKGDGKQNPSNSIAYYTSSSIPARTWVKGSVPLSLFPAGQYDGIWFQDQNNNAQGTLYFDQITLVPKSRTGFAPTNNTIDNDGNAENPGSPSTQTKKTDTSTLIITNVVTALVTLTVVSVVVVSVYMYRKKRTASAYNYKEFVENGQL